MYTGGHFEKRGGLYPHNRLEALDAATGVRQTWSPVLNSNFGVWELDASPFGLLVGGDFTRIDGRGSRGVTVYPQLDFGLAGGGGADTTLPTGSILSPAAGGSVVMPATMTGNATDDTQVARLRVTIRNRATRDYVQSDGVTLASGWAFLEPTIIGGASVNWSLALDGLPPGNYVARVKTTDLAGNFDDPCFAQSAPALHNPDFVEVVIHSYRHRYGLTPGDAQFDLLEDQLTDNPTITVPTICLDGASNHVSPMQEADWIKQQFPALVEHRVIPRIGHNIPQESPDIFAQAVMALDPV